MGETFDFWRVGCERRVSNEYKHLELADRKLIVEAAVELLKSGELTSPSDAVARAVTEFEIEGETEDFVKTMQSLVSLREPVIDHVNVLVSPTGSFRLVDTTGIAINSEYLKEAAELVESAVDLEDLLVSALITLAPHKITFHQAVESKTYDLTLRIFAGMTTTCQQCDLCKAKEIPT